MSEPATDGTTGSGPARPHLLVRILRAILGATLVAGGIVLLVLPGPGLLLIIAGLGVLAVDHAFAARLRDRLLAHASDAGRRAGSAARRILVGMLVLLAATTLVTVALTALVVAALS